MKKRILVLAAAAVFACATLVGCGAKEKETESTVIVEEDTEVVTEVVTTEAETEAPTEAEEDTEIEEVVVETELETVEVTTEA